MMKEEMSEETTTASHLHIRMLPSHVPSEVAEEVGCMSILKKV